MRSLFKMRSVTTTTIQPILSEVEFTQILHSCLLTAQELEFELPNLVDCCNSFELSAALTDAIQIARRRTHKIAELFHVLDLSPTLSHLDVKSDLAILRNLHNEFATGFSLDNAIILQFQKIISTDIQNMKALINYLADDNDEATTYLTSAILEAKAANSVLTQIAFQAIYFDRAV